jgi:hypothetical protein
MIKKYTKTDSNSQSYEVEYNIYFQDEIDNKDTSFQYLLWFFIKDDGTTCKDIDENFMKILSDSLKAIYAGKKVDDGWCEFYFYANSAKGFESQLRSLLAKIGIKNFESGSSKDAEYIQFYEKLYPSELEVLILQSDEIINDLSNAGDDLAKVRDVEHYFVFQTKSLRDKFLDSCEYGDFEEFENDGDFVYGLTLHVEHSPQDVKKFIEEFYAKALEYSARYELYSTTLS